ncbi:MAG: hypothetical protein OXC40_03310 [Proteobacteria bacterium]|nr:hypothetical protein [Pseudomonadota bacterium]
MLRHQMQRFCQKLTSHFMMLAMVSVIMTAGCRSLPTGNDLSQSELQKIRDKFYVLKLARDDVSGQFQFLVCHISEGRRVANSPDTGYGCVNAFRSASGQDVMFSADVINNHIETWNKQGESGDNSDNIVDIDGKKYQLMLTEAEKKELKKISNVGVVGNVQAGLVGGSMMVGTIIFVKIAAVVLPVAAVLGIGAGALFTVNEEFLSSKGIDAQQLKSQIKEQSQRLVSKGGDAMVDTTARLAKEILANKDKQSESKTTFHVVVWGQSGRTLANNWGKLLDANSDNVPRTVGARIPDVLPTLARLIEDIGWVSRGQIEMHCLPGELSQSMVSQQVCLGLNKPWHTGGITRYIKPISE